MYKRIVSVVMFLALAGCVSAPDLIERADETKPVDPGKAIIVGFVSEAFLTQPHGLNVMLKYHNPDAQAKDTRIAITTMDHENEISGNKHILGNSFVYQVPAGTYEITHWFYHYYNSMSREQDKKLLFSVKPGEVVYIGSFNANALLMCLYSKDDFPRVITDIKKAHPFLENMQVENRSQELQFPGWPSAKATDVFKKGLCQIQ